MSNCPYYDIIHTGVCARVKSIDYHENGTVKKVEFHEPVDLPSLRPFDIQTT